MANDTGIESVSAAHAQRVTAVERVSPAKALQSLPQEGKELPSDKSKADAEDVNIEQSAEIMNEYAQSVKRQLQFTIDKESGRTVITVLDSDTLEVIRQIPREEALRFARMLKQGDDLEIFNHFV
ncbi:MAG: flagellar protein FlaG [Gammaproteobacteria bacterium]|nr:flagellar protein FlaG [Gammaproteobacteria bacterium]